MAVHAIWRVLFDGCLLAVKPTKLNFGLDGKNVPKGASQVLMGRLYKLALPAPPIDELIPEIAVTKLC